MRIIKKSELIPQFAEMKIIFEEVGDINNLDLLNNLLKSLDNNLKSEFDYVYNVYKTVYGGLK